MKEESLMPETQSALLKAEKLAEILSNPVFSEVSEMQLYKEQQFLVSLPAENLRLKEIQSCGGVFKEEEILFQGAIDLLAVSDSGEAQHYRL